jgi:hypothetical protein
VAVSTGGWKRGAPQQDEAPVDEAFVYAKLAERENARRAKDFDLADDIMDELTNSGVAFLDDREKTWFAFAPPAAGSASADMSGGGGGGALSFGPDNNLGKRAGDWACPECGANVFASKSACYRCSCPRPGGPGPRARDVDGGGRDMQRGGSERQSWAADERGWGGDAGPQRSSRFPPFVRQRGDRAQVDEVEVEELIEQRETARKGRDYYTADSIRDMLQVSPASPQPPNLHPRPCTLNLKLLRRQHLRSALDPPRTLSRRPVLRVPCDAHAD